jgi:flagellar motility protein MotE (MotC chaperone)
MMKRRKSYLFKKGRGSVLVIASLLFGSAALRVGIGAGQAVATENALDTPSRMEQAVQTAEAAPDLSQYGRMLEAFQKREAALVEKEQRLEVRLKALSVADHEIERRLQAMEDAENQLRDMLAIASTAAEDDLTRLTSVYENMKPKDAAALFEEMEPAFAAGFLGRMKPAAAAGVMAGLTPQTAYSVSVILAGRNAGVPDRETANTDF